MVRKIEVNSKELARLPPGTHWVAPTLYAQIGHSPRARSWVQIYWSPVLRRRVELGLGSMALVRLAEAKELAHDNRRSIQAGRCPKTERQNQQRALVARVPAFDEVAALFVAAHRAGWKNAKHLLQWDATLRACAPVLGALPVSDITTGDVMRLLEPLASRTPETASRVRSRIERILAFAQTRGWRAGENPARWAGHIEHLMPRRSAVAPVRHHRAVPWQDIPPLWRELEARGGLGAAILRFALATAGRTNEVLGALWDEIDLDARLWVIPAARMKERLLHSVPLSDEALRVLEAMAAVRQSEFVFPGRTPGKRAGEITALNLLKQLRGAVTVHGTCRGGFRTWCADHGVADALAEAALAHRLDKLAAAYIRTDRLSLRRGLMDRWGAYLSRGAVLPNVVELTPAA
jgi:integrase